MTHIKPQDIRKLLGALIIIPMMLAMFGAPTPAAAKCDPATNPNCPTDAPGQEPVTPPTTGSVTVVSGTLINNGGQPVQGGGNGVLNQALSGSTNASVTIIVSPDTVLNLPATTNATVIVAGATDVDAVPDLTDDAVTIANNTANTGGNPHLVDPVLLEAFEATLNFGCGTGASHSNVACWNHFTMTTLYKVQRNGTLKPVCRDTSNANNELVRDNGGWLVILSKFYTGVQNGTYELGPTYQCGGNPNGSVQ